MKKDSCPGAHLNLGCFADKINSHNLDLSGLVGISGSPKMTIDQCISYCVGFKYAGLQNGFIFEISNVYSIH